MDKRYIRKGFSLAGRIQVQIGLVIALVIIAVTLLSYEYSMGSMRKQTLDALGDSVSSRRRVPWPPQRMTTGISCLGGLAISGPRAGGVSGDFITLPGIEPRRRQAGNRGERWF